MMDHRHKIADTDSMAADSSCSTDSSVPYPTRLTQNLYQFSQDNILTDFVIKVKNREIHCHQAVISASSDYFKSLCLSGMAEAVLEYSVVKHNAAIVAMVVKFMYTGQVDITGENVESLLTSADFIMQKHLKDTCENFLISNLSAKNLSTYQKLSEKFRLERLKAQCNQWSRANFSAVVDTDWFLSLSLEEVVDYLKGDSLNVSAEDEVMTAMLRWLDNAVESQSLKDEYLEHLFPCVRLQFCTRAKLETMTKDANTMVHLKCKLLEFLHHGMYRQGEARQTYTAPALSKPSAPTFTAPNPTYTEPAPSKPSAPTYTEPAPSKPSAPTYTEPTPSKPSAPTYTEPAPSKPSTLTEASVTISLASGEPPLPKRGSTWRSEARKPQPTPPETREPQPTPPEETEFPKTSVKATAAKFSRKSHDHSSRKSYDHSAISKEASTQPTSKSLTPTASSRPQAKPSRSSSTRVHTSGGVIPKPSVSPSTDRSTRDLTAKGTKSAKLKKSQDEDEQRSRRDLTSKPLEPPFKTRSRTDLSSEGTAPAKPRKKSQDKDEQQQCDHIAIIGGVKSGGIKLNKNIYSMDSNYQSAVQTQILLNADTYNFSVCASEDFLIMSGGLTRDTDLPTKGVWKFSFATKCWESLPDMPLARDNHASACFRNKLYIMAGHCGKNSDDEDPKMCEETLVLDLQTLIWKEGEKIPKTLSKPGVAVADSSIVLVGEHRSSKTRSKTLLCMYNTTKSKWQLVKQVRRDGLAWRATVAVGNQLYVLMLEAFLQYDIPNDRWIDLPRPEKPVAGFAMVYMGGKLVALGGRDKDSTDYVQTYDMADRKWSVEEDRKMPLALWGHWAVPVKNGKK